MIFIRSHFSRYDFVINSMDVFVNLIKRDPQVRIRKKRFSSCIYQTIT